jgi:hypothetical protein
VYLTYCLSSVPGLAYRDSNEESTEPAILFPLETHVENYAKALRQHHGDTKDLADDKKI